MEIQFYCIYVHLPNWPQAIYKFAITWVGSDPSSPAVASRALESQRREDHLDLILDRAADVVQVKLWVLWRLVATTITFVISWVVTGSVLAGGAIASIEFWAKLALYYAHERAWARAC